VACHNLLAMTRSRIWRCGAFVAGAIAHLVVAAIVAAAPTLPASLSPAIRARLEAVSQAAAVSAHVEADPFPARPEVFAYLLDHPEFASKVTRVLKAARYRIWRDADGLRLDDGWGTIGRFEVVYATGRTRVLHARGTYSKRLLPDIHGEAVVMIEYDVRRAPDGRPLIAAAVTGHVKLDNGLLSGMAKFAGPVAQAKADREARGLVRVFAKVMRLGDEQPAALCRDLAEQPDVSAHERSEFCTLLGAR
jgi:hypothetical protein